MNLMENAFRRILPTALALVMCLVTGSFSAAALSAQSTTRSGVPTAIAAGTAAAPQAQPGGEANLVIPDLSQVEFFGIKGRSLLLGGLFVCALGLLFGLVMYT